VKHTFNLSTYDEDELDALPFGIIHLDEKGMVLDYNSYEADLARLPKEHVVGKNFFAQIAPCTDVPEFYGRFAAGIRSGTLQEHFIFEFPFAHGARQVLIQMIGDAPTKTAWIFVADSSQVIKLRLDENRTITLWQVAGSSDGLNRSDA